MDDEERGAASGAARGTVVLYERGGRRTSSSASTDGRSIKLRFSTLTYCASGSATGLNRTDD